MTANWASRMIRTSGNLIMAMIVLFVTGLPEPAASQLINRQDFMDSSSRAPSATRHPPVTEKDRFQLWTGCQPVRYRTTVEVAKRARTTTLSRSTVDKAADKIFRSRLKAAQLYDGDWEGKVQLAVHLDRETVFIRITFLKQVFDYLSGNNNFTETWAAGGVTQYTEVENVLVLVSRSIDAFIREYLRVNAKACNRHRQQ